MLRSVLNPAGNESVCHFFVIYIFLFISYDALYHSWSMVHGPIKLVHRLYIFSILMSSLTFPTTVLLLTPTQPGRRSSLQARLQLTSPTSAFQTPSINRSTLYDGRTTPNHTLMKSPLGQGPSPTCVASTVIFDGDVGSVVNTPPYAYDVTAPIPNEHRSITALNIKPKYATYSNPSSGNNGSGRGGGGGRSNRRSSNASNNRPNIASGDGGERPPPHNNNPRESPTPQNLRDNPERLAKVKTEMCHFYEEGGVKNCPFGASCEFCILFIYLFFVGGNI